MLADYLSFVTLARGDVLCHPGDRGDSMYIVDRGLLEVRAPHWRWPDG